MGSLVRLIFGLVFEPWTQSPDQMAWELVLQQNVFSYDHLIHYPHEGGTILISLLSQFIRLFTNLNSLSIAAFILDFSLRFIQIKIVNSVFNLRLAIWFGIWTIFATPSLLPWGTLNFGLHSIASVFPFIFLNLLFQKNFSIKHHFFCGLFLGLTFWFSYSNIILIPIYFIYRLITKTPIKLWLYSVLSLSLVLAVHFLVRANFDAGFHLNKIEMGSIRGENFSIADLPLFERFCEIPTVLANSFLALPKSNAYMKVFQILFYSLLSLSAFGFFYGLRKKKFEPSLSIIFPIILLFLILYLFSPFYYSKDQGNHVAFRHLTYILPLVALFCIAGFSALKYNQVFILMFLSLGFIRSGQLFLQEKLPKNEMMETATGWVLATKFGHAPNILMHIVAMHPEKQKILLKGIGWGMSTAIFQNLKQPFNTSIVNAKVKQLQQLLLEFPIDSQSDLLEGIEYSFSDQVTPQLDGQLFVLLKQNSEQTNPDSLSPSK